VLIASFPAFNSRRRGATSAALNKFAFDMLGRAFEIETRLPQKALFAIIQLKANHRLH